MDAYGGKVMEWHLTYPDAPTAANRIDYSSRSPVGFGGQFGYYTDYALSIPTSSVSSPASSNLNPGIILCGHLYYDPVNARWLTRDPAGYDGGINLYAYCDGNPVMMNDPSGLAHKPAWWNPFSWDWSWLAPHKPAPLTPKEQKVWNQLFLNQVPDVDPDYVPGAGPALSEACRYTGEFAHIYCMSGGFGGHGGGSEKFSQIGSAEDFAAWQEANTSPSDPQARIDHLIGKYRLKKTGRSVIYGGNNGITSGGVRVNDPFTIRIYDAGLFGTDREFVETFFEEMHHSKLLSSTPIYGNAEFNGWWDKYAEPRAKRYAKGRADRLGLPH